MNCNITSSKIPLQKTLAKEMKKIPFCSICNKTFKNATSLASHRYKFHKLEQQPSNNVDGKALPSQPTFGSVITSRRDINRKSYPGNEDLSDESKDIEDIAKSKLIEEKLTKKRALTMEETSDDSEVENKRTYKKHRKFDEIFNDLNLSSGEQYDEYNSKLRFKGAQLEKNRNERIARKLENQNMDEEKESITKLGNDEREDREEMHTSPSIRDVEGRGLVHEIILESLEKNGDRKFKEIEDSIDYIYKENAFIGIPYVERVLYNCVEIQDLFKENNHKAIQLNIEKLKNAAKYASGYFKPLGNLSKEEESLLDTISDASLFKARTLLDQNYDILKSMLTELPTFDILKEVVANIKDGIHSKHSSNISLSSKDLQSKASSSDGESTDWGNESTKSELANSQSKASSSDGESTDWGNESTENGATKEEFPQLESANTIGSEDENTIGDNSSNVSDDSSIPDNETTV